VPIASRRRSGESINRKRRTSHFPPRQREKREKVVFLTPFWLAKGGEEIDFSSSEEGGRGIYSARVEVLEEGKSIPFFLRGKGFSFLVALGRLGGRGIDHGGKSHAREKRTRRPLPF